MRQGSVLSLTLFAIYDNDIISRLPFGQNYVIVLYADDILLLVSLATELQTLLSKREIELAWLDMVINAKKSCSLRIESRCNVKCQTAEGQRLPWLDKMRCLGVGVYMTHP